jgi:hypothetical protein
MPEVNASFEQLLHCDRGQWASLLSCIRAGFAFPGLNPLARELKSQFAVLSSKFTVRTLIEQARQL